MDDSVRLPAYVCNLFAVTRPSHVLILTMRPLPGERLGRLLTFSIEDIKLPEPVLGTFHGDEDLFRIAGPGDNRANQLVLRSCLRRKQDLESFVSPLGTDTSNLLGSVVTRSDEADRLAVGLPA